KSQHRKSCIARIGFLSKLEYLVEVHRCFREIVGQLKLDQAAIERVNSCRDRCMCRIYGSRTNNFKRLLERQIIFLPIGVNPFDSRKGSESLVEMDDRRLDSDRTECAHTANTEEHLLSDPSDSVSPIEGIRRVAMVG